MYLTVKKYLLGLLALVFPALLLGQLFVAGADKNTVAVGEPFEVFFRIQGGKPSQFTPPVFDPSIVEVIGGPNNEMSVSIVNGATSEIYSISYIISAKKEGTIQIGQAGVNVNGRRMFSQPIAIKALSNNSGGSPSQNDADIQKKLGDDVLLLAITDKNQVKVGEKVTLTYRLLTRHNLSQPEISKNPEYTGFWTEELPGTKAIEQHLTYNGKNYSAYDIKKVVLFPQKAGKLAVPSLELTALVEVKTPHKLDPYGLFDKIFGGGGTTQSYPLTFASPVSYLTVDELPKAGKPVGFNGLVGKYQMEAMMLENAVKGGDIIKVKVTVTGEGNLKMVPAPALNLPPHCEKFDPTIEDHINKNPGDVTGFRTFHYSFSPQKGGSYTLPSIVLYFYNPEMGKYDSIQTAAFPFTVEGDAPNFVPEAEDTPSQSSTLGAIWKEWGTLMITFVLLIAIGVFFALGYRPKFTPTTVVSKVPETKIEAVTPIVSEKPLQAEIEPLVHAPTHEHTHTTSIISTPETWQHTHHAPAIMPLPDFQSTRIPIIKGDRKAFFAALSHDIMPYLAGKLGIPLQDANKSVILEALEQKNVSFHHLQVLREVLDKCELAAFTPIEPQGDMEELLAQTQLALRALQNS